MVNKKELTNAMSGGFRTWFQSWTTFTVRSTIFSIKNKKRTYDRNNTNRKTYKITLKYIQEESENI